MDSTSTVASSSMLAAPSPTTIPDDPVPAHHANPVVAFIIGLSIVLLASILNAGGLNLTKLDHVRTSAIPKASRRKDWLRPLWLLGMLLYILSQLIGSTLALEYLRAEYVAPLGSTSLIFNFLFASMLVGTPVTSTDIYGTIIVTVGVVGIVLFGSINHGLETEMDLSRLKELWGRLNWILYFVFMALALILVYVFVSQLEYILNGRSDISSEPFAGQSRNRNDAAGAGKGWRAKIMSGYQGTLIWVRERLEDWTAAKDDKTLAWTLGIGWACCGGGLAGGCLVFAKASVKLISGKMSHVNTGNQFVHVAAFATFIFLALTAVFQIICLNRGLKAYDSTLVVPVFYGVYTGTGFLNALVFNNEVDQYESWTLFLIFVSIAVLISGVVLLTHKKPESKAKPLEGAALALSSIPSARKLKGDVSKDDAGSASAAGSHEEEALHVRQDVEAEDPILWELGDASDDEDNAPMHGRRDSKDQGAAKNGGAVSKVGLAGSAHGEEGRGLMQRDDLDEW